jgi:hypothetical protein
MVGTASTVRTWLLVEHPGPWGRDGLRDARLPMGLGDELRRRERAHGVRVLLVRRHGRTDPGATAVTAIRSGPGVPWAERTRLDRIDDVIGIDTQALGKGERPGFQPVADPLYVVCTHGRRDPCCAERGRPLVKALTQAFPEQSLESIHVGGDRFAGNIVAFPHGLYFGRVEPERGPSVCRSYAEQRIDLARYRGRSCYPMGAQAAEYFLRVERQLEGIDDANLDGYRPRKGLILATFTTPLGRFDVQVQRRPGRPNVLTCHSDHEERPPEYRLLKIDPG